MNGWKITDIKNIGEIVTGSTPSTFDKENYGDEFLWASPADLGDSKYIYETVTKLSKKGFNKTRKLPKGSILVVCIGSIGKVGIAIQEMATNQQINSLICSKDVDSDFVYYAITNAIPKHTALIATQVVPIINKRQFSNFKINIPTLLEQRRIATALSDMDDLISAQEKLIAKKRNIKQGVMQELLTGRKRLPGFKGGWKDVRIGDIGNTYSGLTGKKKEDFGTGKARYITFLNVLLNTVIDTTILESVDVGEDEFQNTVQFGDLFFNTSSETPNEVGMCAVLLRNLKNTYLNSFCFGFRLIDPKVNGLFLSYYFNSQYGRNIMTVLAQGATRYNLSKAYFNDICVKLPSFQEQSAIAQVLSDMDDLISEQEKLIAKLKQIKQGMMSELLTGRVRLTMKENSKNGKH